MYKLNHVKLNSDKDILLEFDSFKSMAEYAEDNELDNRVYLFTKEPANDNEIIITQWMCFVVSAIEENNLAWTEEGIFVLQEYSSFESAYDVAKRMKDGNPLCDHLVTLKQ